MSPGRDAVARLTELLADRASGQTLAPRAAGEIDLLLALHPEVEEASFERAAAALHLALLGPAREELPAGVRARLLALVLRTEVLAAADAVTICWTPAGDPDGEGVSGEVVWSDALQAGFLHFRGLPENDPARGQYQLWIFDADHPAETPVDGGVFDATAPDLWVPIDAGLRVSAPSLFAVTYERPGGVVVSSRERLLLTAAGRS